MSLCVAHMCVKLGRTQWHARPLVCPPHPPLIPPTSPLAIPHPNSPLPPCLSLPLWPLPLHTRLVCPAVVHRPTSPLSACACLRVCCAARYGFHLCGRVTAGLTPGCVGVTRREGPPVSKPPLSLPLPRVVPPLRRPTPPYPPLCTPPHTPLSGHRLGLETQCTHVVRLCRLRRALGIIVEKFFACARGTSRPERVSLREGSHCCLAAAGAAARAQLHAYPGGGSWGAFPPQ